MSGRYIECGKAGRPWGVKGGMGVFWNNPEPPVEVGDAIYIKQGSDYEAFTVRALKVSSNRSILELEGIDTPEEAAKFTSQLFFVPEENLSDLGDGEYYTYQLVGLKVITEEGQEIGSITGVLQTGANDVYEVLPEGAKQGEELLIPAIEDVIAQIDLEQDVVTIRNIKGLFDES